MEDGLEKNQQTTVKCEYKKNTMSMQNSAANLRDSTALQKLY